MANLRALGKVAVALMVVLMLSLPSSVFATLSTVTSNSNGPPNPGVGITFQHKIWFDRGLFWYFYADGAGDLMYQTSADGSSWSSATYIAANTYDAYFSTWVNSTTHTLFYIRITTSPSNAFYLRWGTLNTDGSISWLVTENGYSNSICGGLWGPNIWGEVIGTVYHVWMSFPDQNCISNDYQVDIRNYVGTGIGQPSRTSQIDIQGLCQPSAYVGVLQPTSTGMVAVIGNSDYTCPVYAYTSSDGGSTWVGPVLSTHYYNVALGVMVIQGNTVYGVALRSSQTPNPTTTGVGFFKWVIGGGSFTEQLLVPEDSNLWNPTLALKPATNQIMVFYGHETGTTLSYRLSNDSGTTWGTAKIFAPSEHPFTTDAGIAGEIVATPVITSSTLGVSWLTGTFGTIYYLRFFTTPIADPPAPPVGGACGSINNAQTQVIGAFNLLAVGLIVFAAVIVLSVVMLIREGGEVDFSSFFGNMWIVVIMAAILVIGLVFVASIIQSVSIPLGC